MAMGERTTVNRTVIEVTYGRDTLHLDSDLNIGPNELIIMVRNSGIILWDNRGEWGIVTKQQMWTLLEEWAHRQIPPPVGPGPSAVFAGVSFADVIHISVKAAQALRLSPLHGGRPNTI